MSTASANDPLKIFMTLPTEYSDVSDTLVAENEVF